VSSDDGLEWSSSIIVAHAFALNGDKCTATRGRSVIFRVDGQSLISRLPTRGWNAVCDNFSIFRCHNHSGVRS